MLDLQPTVQVRLHFLIGIRHRSDLLQQIDSTADHMHLLLRGLLRIAAGKTVLLDQDDYASRLDYLGLAEEVRVLVGLEGGLPHHLVDRPYALLVLAIGLVGEGQVAVVSYVRVGKCLSIALLTIAWL